MGFGSAGATRATTGFRSDSRRVGGTAAHIWLEQPQRVADAGRRFEGVIIENRPAITVMQQHDDVDTLHFVDPPYVHDTRVLRSRHINGKYGEYRHEMTNEDHLELIEALKQLRGYVVLCGYPNPLYAEALKGWRTSTTTSRISAGRGGATRTEVIWINPACQAAIDGNTGALFEAA